MEKNKAIEIIDKIDDIVDYENNAMGDFDPIQIFDDIQELLSDLRNQCK